MKRLSEIKKEVDDYLDGYKQELVLDILNTETDFDIDFEVTKIMRRYGNKRKLWKHIQEVEESSSKYCFLIKGLSLYVFNQEHKERDILVNSFRRNNEKTN